LNVPGVQASVRRVLYLDGCTVQAEQVEATGSAPSGDAIGSGITASTSSHTGLSAAKSNE
jgi:hypothetical protein